MLPAGPTHYDVLELEQDASAEAIKRRYRELARRFHPDVAKGAEERFRAIVEAYRVLADPERRKTYDAEIELARLRRPVTEPFIYGGRTDQKPVSTSGSKAGEPTRSPKNRPPAVSDIIAEAELAYKRMKFREAEAYCRQALRLDRRNAAAYEILGDIQWARGRSDEAIAMYSYVLQLDRSRHSAQIKFDKLTGQKSGPTMAGHAARTGHRAQRQPTARRGPTPASRVLVTGIGVAALSFLVILTSANRSPLALGPLPTAWDVQLLFSLAAAGATCGFLLALHGFLDLQQAHLSRTSGGIARRGIPLGAALVAVSLVSFYAAFLLYAMAGVVQNAITRSLNVAFATSFVITALFALVAQIGGVWVLLSGGNIVLVALVAGWAMGARYLR